MLGFGEQAAAQRMDVCRDRKRAQDLQRLQHLMKTHKYMPFHPVEAVSSVTDAKTKRWHDFPERGINIADRLKSIDMSCTI